MRAFQWVAQVLMLIIGATSIFAADGNIVINPSAITVGAGVPVRLSVFTPGDSVATMQLLRDGVPVPGATNRAMNPTFFRLTNLTAQASGTYSVRITNWQGQVRSGGAAVVRVVPPMLFRTVATVPFPRAHGNINVSGDKVFLAAGALYIYDVSHPSNPALLISRTNSAGSFYNVAARDSKAVAVGGTMTNCFAELLDISNPAQPALAAQFSPGEFIYGLALLDNLAYLAGDQSLQIWNVAATPVLLGAVPTGGALRMEVTQNVAYLVRPSTGLQIIDVSNPTAPRIHATLTTPLMADDVRLSGNRLYLSGTQLSVWDATDRLNPRLLDANQRLGLTPAHANSILCKGAFVFVGNTETTLGTRSFLSVFEASDPNHLVELGRHAFESGLGVQSAAMAGDYLFLAGLDKWEIVEMLPADEPPVVLREIGRVLTVAGAPAKLEVHATGHFHSVAPIAGETARGAPLPN